jgi:hypothetical protein
MGTALVSFDAYQMQILPKGYVASTSEFLKNDFYSVELFGKEVINPIKSTYK